MNPRNSFLFALILLSILHTLAGCEGNTKSGVQDEPFDPSPWVARGQEIQKQVFGTLSGRLAEALGEGGVQGAAAYCQLIAYPITDSLTAIHHAEIRRATLQPRNPSNRATAEEADVLAAYRKDILAGKEPAPMAVETSGGVSYYSPIRIQALCLNCHGVVGTDMKEEDHAFLRSRYPGDQATGYSLGDLRGIWHIRFLKEALRPM